jgi:hypothetical protein
MLLRTDRRPQFSSQSAKKAGDLATSPYPAHPIIVFVLAHKTHDIYRGSTSSESVERILELLFEAKGVAMPGPNPRASLRTSTGGNGDP